MRQPRFAIRFVGGPWNGRQRNIEGSPHELASPVAMPLGRAARNVARDSERLAVYQLRNENGEWSYCHVHTANAAELGVDAPNGERHRQEEWTAVA